MSLEDAINNLAKAISHLANSRQPYQTDEVAIPPITPAVGIDFPMTQSVEFSDKEAKKQKAAATRAKNKAAKEAKKKSALDILDDGLEMDNGLLDITEDPEAALDAPQATMQDVKKILHQVVAALQSDEEAKVAFKAVGAENLTDLKPEQCGPLVQSLQTILDGAK